jgi:hypothetical protein
MADITSKYQGNVSDEGQQGPWRDAVVPMGGQSIYETSSVQLADLGSRKVVGDRVFRYSLASGTVAAGEFCEAAPASVLLATAGAVLGTKGAKVFNWYSATAIVKDYWAEGYLVSQSGTAGNTGYMYKVKSHPAIATTSTGTLTLYDPVAHTVNTADKYTIMQHPNKAVLQITAATGIVAGVAPISVVSGDYFWLQTWGPCCIKSSAVGVAGNPVSPGATGELYDFVVGTTAGNAKKLVGYSMQVMTASEKGICFLTVHP